MRKLALVPTLVLFCLFSALASEPGQPLDCTDWVFVEPGLGCTTVIPDCSAADPAVQPFCFAGEEKLDVRGSQLAVVQVPLPETLICEGVPVTAATRTQIVRYDGSTVSVLAYIDDRCATFGHWDDTYRATGPGFDPYNGRILLVMNASCETEGNFPSCVVAGVYYNRRSLIAITGFATLLEVLLTYQPTTADLAFRVPYMPEGFQYAAYFDTYYGTLATVGDWSQAQPLECGYPATPPDVGDYLTVADTLPTPGPGQGYYYVTAVTYQGERRYGRKCVNGVLSGRDPAVLPGCGTQ